MNNLLLFTLTVGFLFQSGCNGQSNQEQDPTVEPQAELQFLDNLKNCRQWPAFRGFAARGYLDKANLPDHWDVETMENVGWKIPIPGLGLSCPVVWDSTIFITTAVGEPGERGIKTGMYGEGKPVDDESELQWKVIAIHTQTGVVLWERTAYSGIPEVKRHPKSSHANPTVATDGKHVVAFFGSEGVYCYDFDGNLLWEKDFGLLMSSAHGSDYAEWEFASSPIIHMNRVIIQADVKENSFLASLEIETGEIIWKQDRDDWPGWCTPNIYYHKGLARVAVNGYKHRGAYDFETGEEVWKMSGGGDVPIHTQVQHNDMIYFNSAHGKQNPILVMKTGATGNIRYPEKARHNEAVAWFKDRGGSYMQTLLIYNNLLYNLKWNGNLECYDASTGEQLYRENIDTDSFIASPVAADGKIYCVSEEGEVFIIKAGPTFQLLNSISLGEITLSTPAIAEGIIIFRTTGHLFGISKQE